MSVQTAITGARIFDGDAWHDGKALLAENGKIVDIRAESALPGGIETITADGRLIVPGFIDLQVNGGGGVLLNHQQDVDAIRQICAAHAKFGTTALLPTLITETFEIRAKTVAAGIEARKAGVPGFLGLHIEGPHLSIARKGAHDPSLIRPMEEADLKALLACADAFEGLMVTVAPENTTVEQVAALARAGVVVSLGHTDVGYATVKAYAEAGARTVTHLFNAMSQLGNREPGVVGAALDLGSLYAGIIADGIHVNPASMGAALRAKQGPGRIFIVTDAMSTIGSDLTGFFLNGREIFRRDGRLELANGTLAGADIDMLSSVRFVHETLGVALEEALRMGSAYAAEAMRVDDRKGRLAAGYDADFVILTDTLEMAATYIAGRCVYTA